MTVEADQVRVELRLVAGQVGCPDCRGALQTTPKKRSMFIFRRQIIDPVSQSRDFVEKRQVLAELRNAYHRAHIASALIRPKVEFYTGAYIHTPVDFAIANSTTIQPTQGWSLQRNSVDEVSVQVKSWGYALRLLRDGQDARVVDSENRIATISSDIDLQVVVASPKNRKQVAAFDGARQSIHRTQRIRPRPC